MDSFVMKNWPRLIQFVGIFWYNSIWLSLYRLTINQLIASINNYNGGWHQHPKFKLPHIPRWFVIEVFVITLPQAVCYKCIILFCQFTDINPDYFFLISTDTPRRWQHTLWSYSLAFNMKDSSLILNICSVYIYIFIYIYECVRKWVLCIVSQ